MNFFFKAGKLHWLGCTSAVKRLSLLMVGVYVIQRVMSMVDWDPRFPYNPSTFDQLFMLVPQAAFHGRMWQFGSYVLLHGPIWHLLSNLLGFVMIGPEVERTMGTRQFYVLFWVSGILAGLGHALLRGDWLVGASGAIFGVLGALVALYPKRKVFIIFLPWFPFKSIWLIPGMFLLHIGFILHWFPWDLPIAYENHLVGMTTGLAYTALVFRVVMQKKCTALPLPILLGSSLSLLRKGEEGGRFRKVLNKASEEGLDALNPEELGLLKTLFPSLPSLPADPTLPLAPKETLK